MISNNNKFVKNAAYLTLLNSVLDDDCNKIGIGDAVEAYECGDNSYWKKFGLKYFSLADWYSEGDLKGYYRSTCYAENQFIGKLVWLVCENDLENNRSIQNEILEGITEGKETFAKAGLNKVTPEVAAVGFEYLAKYISDYDKRNIYEAVYAVEIEGKQECLPISTTDRFRFGMVYPWPGMNTAETELLARASKAAKNIGFECVMLSDYGQVLDSNQLATDDFIDDKTLDYVMTTHYESHKAVDAYYYHLLWNPPEIPLNTEYYDGRVVDNYIMNDDYLIYDFGGMSNHLKSILMNKPRNIEHASTFVGSFPKSVIKEPNLSNPKLFYCGMNWEKASGNNNRHAGLFQMLDETGKIKFYGPDKVKEWGGIRPWEGYKCYQHSIPFDGFSILDEINSCGICLAISSDAHRRAGAVTNRAYEACAAGAVIISDDNVFMEEYFKDSVLYITYNKENPEDTFKQIMEKYQWIVEHKEEALEMARKSQRIFVEKFCMEKGLIDVTKNHYSRFKTIERDLYAIDDNQRVMITKVLNTVEKSQIQQKLKRAFSNVEKQYYRNILLVVLCDDTIKEEVENVCRNAHCNINVLSYRLYDEKKSRCMTDGKAIHLALNEIEHDYFMNMTSSEEWFRDHVTTLLRTLEDAPESLMAYSGLLSQDAKGYRRTYIFENLSLATLYNQYPKVTPIGGQFMIRNAAHEMIPDFLFENLDGCEHVMYADSLVVHYKSKIAFSKRMTCIWNIDEKDDTYSILDRNRQIRFIRGTMKYEIESNDLGNGGMNRQEMAQLGQHFPIKSWVKMRYAGKLYGVFRTERLRKKLDDATQKFFDIMISRI